MKSAVKPDGVVLSRPQLSKLEWALGIFAILFGLATIKEGGSVLFLNGSARAEAGNFVPFVLIFNFIAGFFYATAGALLLKRKHWATNIAIGLLAGNLLVFGLLGFHILAAKPYELRTVVAMSIRTSFWLLVTIVLHHSERFGCPLKNKSSPKNPTGGSL